MVCSADDLRGWRDFPKGLRVLLLDGDSISAAELKSKLEDMDYIVSTFCNENEALAAISSKAECFHVAIVEVSAGNSHGCFRFLETAKDLPTIMISNIHCLSTMMKCIALGAAEVLQKPLSEDKLRNIWQHVVHKAFNAGGSVLSKSLKPIKETVASIIQLQSETDRVNMENGSDTDNSDHAVAHDCERSLASDGYPAPSTPQLECGRLIDIGECQDQPNRLIKKESKDHVQESIELKQFFCSESKSVENTCTNSAGTVSLKVDSQSCPAAPITEEEVNSADGSKPVECNGTRESIVSSYSQNGGNVESCRSDDQKKASNHSNSCGTETNRKKMKVDWTPELHRRFVQAVEQLGIDQAIPSKILELMKVEGLTRHNVASHLQKYRMHRRHIMPKENERKWPVQRDPMQRGYMHKPIMAYPPYHYPVWGHPSWSTSGVQMWGPGFPTWQPTEAWLCKTYPTMHADAWGCPVAPPYGLFPQNTRECHGFVENGMDALIKSFDLYPAEEAIDEAVQEVMSQPWLPLPLGLKPPSAESVMSELHMQGISKIPPSKLSRS